MLRSFSVLMGVAGLLLCGCSREQEPAKPTGPKAAEKGSAQPAGTPSTAQQKPQPAATQAGAQVVVYMYSEYIDPEIPKAFQKETGIKVRIDVYEAAEEMMAKLQQAGGVGQYDVIVATNETVPTMAKLKLIQPIDATKVPNAKNIAPRFKSPPYDPGNTYSLPYQWGTVGLAYRKDKIAKMEPSWAMVFDAAKQPGTFVLIDSLRDMIGAALKFQGKSVNSRNAEEVKKAGELILAAKKSPKALGFEGGVGGKNKVAAGQAVMAIVYNGDAIRTMEEEKNLGYVVPKEGTILWVDSMVVPAKAPHAEAAHRFMNYILDAKVGAQLSNFNRYATPNAASLPLIKKEDRENPAIYPSDDDVKKMEFLEDLGSQTPLYDEVWTSVKSR